MSKVWETLNRLVTLLFLHCCRRQCTCMCCQELGDAAERGPEAGACTAQCRGRATAQWHILKLTHQGAALIALCVLSGARWRGWAWTRSRCLYSAMPRMSDSAYSRRWATLPTPTPRWLHRKTTSVTMMATATLRHLITRRQMITIYHQWTFSLRLLLPPLPPRIPVVGLFAGCLAFTRHLTAHTFICMCARWLETVAEEAFLYYLGKYAIMQICHWFVRNLHPEISGTIWDTTIEFFAVCKAKALSMF